MANSSLAIADTIRLAQQHHRAGRGHQAERIYRSILNRDPENAEANHGLGILAFQSGNLDAAAQLIAKAVLRDDGKAVYLNNLGRVLQAQGKLDAALMLYQQAGAVDPGFSDAYNGRGLVLHQLGKLGEAIAAFRQALSVEPKFAEAYNNLGNALEAQGKIGEALAAYRRALEIKPDFAGAHSNLLLCLHYDLKTDMRALLAAHREWNARHAAGMAEGAPPHANALEAERRLRVAYVSADFCGHPVAAFIEPLLGSHDRSAFEVYCYSNVATPDAVTQRLRESAGTWRSIAGMPDQQAAELIREDGIDILVDLSGHTAGHRLSLFARKLAPIQVTYLGYPGTSGLDVMDYRLTDAWTDPPEWADAYYTEELVRLPSGSLCFQSPAKAPELAPLPERPPAQLTFASFNNAAKISPEAIALWARVLKAVPDARLLMKSKSFGDKEAVERVSSLFQQEGIALERLDIVAWLPAGEAHLSMYNRAHIALDTFPYSGCTTTCEALWMGVPVITLMRDEPRSRMSLSLLKQVGLDDCIAVSPQAYVDTAKALASDMDRLRMLRLRLREKMQRSSLSDSAGFTREVESAYRKMWLRYVAAHR